jgi:hypothetical protein
MFLGNRVIIILNIFGLSSIAVNNLLIIIQLNNQNELIAFFKRYCQNKIIICGDKWWYL